MTYQDQEAGLGSEPHIVIVGGGPAGSAVALTLLKYSHIRVSVIEISNLLQQRIGEVTSSGITQLLEYLGINSDLFLSKHISSYESITSWGSDNVQIRNSTFSFLGGGWHLDRSAFDSDLLKEVVLKGGTVYLNSKLCEGTLTSENKWELLINNCGKLEKINADYVIDASGKKGVFSRKLGVAHQRVDKLIGVTVFFENSQSQSHFLSIESNPYGWWYSAMLPNRKIAVSLMTDSDIASVNKFNLYANWQILLKQSNHTFQRVDMNSTRSKVFVNAAHSQIIDCISGNNWIATGDCAVSFDPLSSFGIGHAITSGIECGRALIGHFNSDGSLIDNYGQVITATFQNVITTQNLFYSKEKRWANQLFWSRRHQKI